MAKLQILLADDHAVVREGLKRLIDAEGDMKVVGEASDGAEAIEKAMRLCPDVAVVDVSMSPVNGSEATLKKFYHEAGRIRLQPANPAMQPMLFDADQIQVQGVVIGVMRRY